MQIKGNLYILYVYMYVYILYIDIFLVLPKDVEVGDLCLSTGK